jgi:hypothetical protein
MLFNTFMYLLLLGEEHNDEFPELPPPRAFLGARAVTTIKENKKA